jgi:hypothetical protein
MFRSRGAPATGCLGTGLNAREVWRMTADRYSWTRGSHQTWRPLAVMAHAHAGREAGADSVSAPCEVGARESRVRSWRQSG